jgi:cell shape-determining protein MreD
MSFLLSVPILIFLLVLQTTIVSEVRLLHGSADLILVWLAAYGLTSKDRSGYLLAFFAGGLVSYVSALPWYVFPIGYLVTVAIARFVSSQLWQSPLLSMFAITLVTSIFLYMVSMAGLRINGTFYSFSTSLYHVIIPSIFLNLLLAIPIYALGRDFSSWIFKNEEVT